MLSLLASKLFEQILIEPIQRGAKELHIVSGYASPAMVTKQFEYAQQELRSPISINLHVGMTGHDGLSRTNLLGMQAIPRQASGQIFNCTFSTKGKSDHSKIYVWCSDSGPVEAFIGSANFTQFGFGISPSQSGHHETCVRMDPDEAFEYTIVAARGSIGYQSPDIPRYIDLFDDPQRRPDGEVGTDLGTSNTSFAILPLVQARGALAGQTHQKSALNWGQREGREPNQAYIPIPSTVTKSKFFPPRGVHFQVVTDDGQAFICTVAQDGDKALETPTDNSILGKYFRERLGLDLGSFVKQEDLSRYGANSVKFTKVNDESYRLDFKPTRELLLDLTD